MFLFTRGRHRIPSDHRLGKAIVSSSAMATIGTGSLVALAPTSASASTTVAQVVPRVATSLLPASATLPVPTTLPPSPTTYTVAPGDFLGRIASGIGETWQDLYNNNVAVIGSDPT
jgi:LysM repeat protein